MLLGFYNQILIMSVVGGGLYLLLKLLNLVTIRYFTAAWHYFSYLFLGTFFLIPYYVLLSEFDLNFIPKVDKWVSFSQTVLNTTVNSATGMITVIPGESYRTHYYLELLPYFLMTGTLIFTVIIIVQSYRLNRRIDRACRLADDKGILETFAKCKQELGIGKEIPVYITAYKSTPFLSGVFRPRIVLPNIEFNAEELRYIFLHELTHWKNHDTWLKILMLFINIVHWFNPLAYLARRDIDRLGEAVCDESVTRLMNREERRRYCELILSVLWHIAEPNNLCSAFSDKRGIERRISMIMEAKKNKKWVRILAVAVTLILAVAGTAAAYTATDGGVKGILDSPSNTLTSSSLDNTVSNNVKININKAPDIMADNVGSPEKGESSSPMNENEPIRVYVGPSKRDANVRTRFYPIYQKYHLERTAPDIGKYQVSIDDGSTWLYYRDNPETHATEISADEKNWYGFETAFLSSGFGNCKYYLERNNPNGKRQASYDDGVTWLFLRHNDESQEAEVSTDGVTWQPAPSEW